MERRFKEYYERELGYLYERAAQFASDFPDVARELRISSTEVKDPFVERLLEGVAYLAARVKLKQDGGYQEFLRQILAITHPDLLAPTPSMIVAQFCPDADAKGVTVERGTRLRLSNGRSNAAPCWFVTGHGVELWPMKLESALYKAMPEAPGVRSCSTLRLTFTLPKGSRFADLRQGGALRVPIFLMGNRAEAAKLFRLYRLLVARVTEIHVGVGSPATITHASDAEQSRARIRPLGFSDEEALLPASSAQFTGYRLFKEYFAFPERFRFTELILPVDLLREAAERLEVDVMFDDIDQSLIDRVSATNLRLFCSPAINLFQRKDVLISQPTEEETEYGVIVDPSRPLDHEIYHVEKVGAEFGDRRERVVFHALFGFDPSEATPQGRYFTVHRTRRARYEAIEREGYRSAYIGTDTYVSLVDQENPPYSPDIKALFADVLCTNRDLPLLTAESAEHAVVTLEAALPASVQCVAGPSTPHDPIASATDDQELNVTLQVVGNLAANLMSLLDLYPDERGGRLRAVLSPLAKDQLAARKLLGIRSVSAQRVTRHVESDGPLCVVRAVAASVVIDEQYLPTGESYLFGAVLYEYLARHVSINTMLELVLTGVDGAEIGVWAGRSGQCDAI